MENFKILFLDAFCDHLKWALSSPCCSIRFRFQSMAGADLNSFFRYGRNFAGEFKANALLFLKLLSLEIYTLAEKLLHMLFQTTVLSLLACMNFV